MNARETLLREMTHHHLYMTDERANELLDAYTHELAEQQRQWLRSEGYELDCVCDGCTACLAREYIDRIDPT